MRIIITGGGTGGHIYPGISLAREFQSRDKNNEIIFVGTEHKMESEIIPQEGFRFLGLRVKGIERKFSLESLSALFLFLGSLFTSYGIIKDFKPDLVIGTGGYVSGSVALVSSLLGIPTFIHEQNVIPGITNQFLSLTGKKVFTSFPESAGYFWRKERIVFLGNPIRKSIWQGNKEKIIKENNLDSTKKTILVFGGSKGASTINKMVLHSLYLIEESIWLEWQVLIISGEEDFKNLTEKVTKSPFKETVRVLPYLHNIEDAYDLADLVVCRAGATTIAELSAKGIAAILIPYPYATGNHQLYNARFLESNLAALIIEEKELNREKLAAELSKLLTDNKRLDLLARNSKKLGKRKAAQDIVDNIYDYMECKISPGKTI
ncbi:MAG: undecaprenyldiphospho-muramoylpentapeptide beta-N-acetylglucosaminyltransferase [Atribacterota bacterium]|jgi:UDP-N-acetylglucosamine--N-acetylmuramyl-(pentapeptide) pyrophosphoryl-undecaprenol N-acetylglucosamine transferase|nr:undecaprenyldiphospho-muramoylpentapeptide beta-N-acetylglucosaminyltransferase [Atribacterota bacterium]MDY0383047.1 undecaprenyldiphospho-muramoylpentapeptide beta-N-acetylglucosaminyltransferase [Atribacterota bacterium]